MIEKCMEDWHKHLRGELPGGLDAVLAEDVVFYSPIVFTPQKGRKLTKMYLMAAGATFVSGSGEAGSGGSDEKPAQDKSAEKKTGSDGQGGGGFRYTKEVLAGNQAVLEFETELGGKFVNGVDIITCNDEGKIIEFKVMIRPLQAINLMHQQMKAMLEKMNPG